MRGRLSIANGRWATGWRKLSVWPRWQRKQACWPWSGCRRAPRRRLRMFRSCSHGYVGDVLSTTVIGSGMGWGPTEEPFNAYLNDTKNGATMLSIPLGHAADAICHCLGEVRELSATMTVRRKTFTIAGTGERKPRTA